MRIQPICVLVVIILGAIGPLASADMGARDGFAVYITYPQDVYQVGTQVNVTVHVFYRGEYRDADNVSLLVDWPGDRQLPLSNGSTGMYTATLTIGAGDVWDYNGEVTLEASASLTDEHGLLEASDQVDIYMDGTQFYVSLYSGDPRDHVPRPGEEQDYVVMVKNEYGATDVDEGYPEVTVREDSSYESETLETTRLGVGTYAFSFLVKDNITRSLTYRVEIRFEKTIGPMTYRLGGYISVDVDVLDIWARIISSTAESTELELMALDARGRAVPGAVFDLGWHYVNTSGRWPEFDGSWTADQQGRARVIIDTPELDHYYVYVDGEVTGDGLVQEVDRGFDGHWNSTYQPDPFEVETDVEGTIPLGEPRTITHTVTYDGEPVAAEEVFVYYIDEHNIYHHGAETTDPLGQFDVTIELPADLKPNEPRWSEWVNGHIQWGENRTITGFPFYLPPDYYDGDPADLYDKNLTLEPGDLHPGRSVTVLMDHPEADGEAEDYMIGWRTTSDENWTSWVSATSGYSRASCEWNGDAYEGTFLLPAFVTEDMGIEVLGVLIFIDGKLDVVVRNAVEGLIPSVIPPEPPGAPRALTVVQEIDIVTLDWEAPDDDGGTAITGYIVYRGTSGDALEVLTTTGRSRTFVDTTFTMGQTYHYAVAAVTAAGEGAACVPITLETIEYRPPSPPLDLSDSYDRRRVALEWGPPGDDGGQPVTHYTVLRGDGPDDLQEIGNTSLRTYTDGTVEVGAYYYYAVRATNMIGTGEPCEARRVRADYVVPPSPPDELTAVYRDREVVVNWSVPPDDGGDPITGYAIMRGSGPLEMEHLVDLGPVTGYVDADLEPDVIYYYTVSAVNGMGTGDPSRKVTVHVPGLDPPSAPTGVTVEFIEDMMKVSWQPPEDDGGSPVTGYRVLRGTGDGGLEELTVVTIGTTYFDLQVERGRTYRYSIVAMNAEKEGEPSQAVTLNVPGAVTEEEWTVGWYVFGAMAAVAVVLLVLVFVVLRRQDRTGM